MVFRVMHATIGIGVHQFRHNKIDSGFSYLELSWAICPTMWFSE